MKRIFSILLIVFTINQGFANFAVCNFSAVSTAAVICLKPYVYNLSDTLAFSPHAPSVFTPNYDGVNDIFTFHISGNKNIQCNIYNRWGVKVYEWKGVDGFWDGRTSAGIECPVGVYFYVVVLTDENDAMYEEKGFTYLFR